CRGTLHDGRTCSSAQSQKPLGGSPWPRRASHIPPRAPQTGRPCLGRSRSPPYITAMAAYPTTSGSPVTSPLVAYRNSRPLEAPSSLHTRHMVATGPYPHVLTLRDWMRR